MPAQALEQQEVWTVLERPAAVKDTNDLYDSVQYGTQEDYDTIAERAVEPLIKDCEQAFQTNPRYLQQFQTYADNFCEAMRKFKEEERNTFTNDPSTWKAYISAFRKDLVEARDMAKASHDTLSLRRACDACQRGTAYFVGQRLQNEQRALEYRKNVSETINRAKEFEKIADERPWLKDNQIFQKTIQRLNAASKQAAIDVANIYNATHPEEDLHPGISQEYMKEADKRLKDLNRAGRAAETTLRIMIGRHAEWKDESWDEVKEDASLAQESVSFAKEKAEQVSKAIQKLAVGIKKSLKQSLSILRGIKGTPDKEILNQKAQTAGLAVAQSATVLGDKGFDKAVDAMGKRIEKAAEKRTFIEKTGAR